MEIPIVDLVERESKFCRLNEDNANKNLSMARDC